MSREERTVLLSALVVACLFGYASGWFWRGRFEPRDDLVECRARLAVYREPDAGPPVEQCFNVRCLPNYPDQPWQRVCVEGRR